MKENFTKKDLKDGMIIEQFDGFKGIVIGDYVVGAICTNSLERYTKDLRWTADSSQTIGLYDVIKVYKPSDTHVNLSCYEEFFDNKKSVWFELIWERKEKKEIKLTTEERAFLNSILLVSDYKYIARDGRDGQNTLWVYKNKPRKSCSFSKWYPDGDSIGDYREITDKTKGMFEFITFDEEPCSIEDLLKL